MLVKQGLILNETFSALIEDIMITKKVSLYENRLSFGMETFSGLTENIMDHKKVSFNAIGGSI